jgi:hypothetical protein
MKLCKISNKQKEFNVKTEMKDKNFTWTFS